MADIYEYSGPDAAAGDKTLRLPDADRAELRDEKSGRFGFGLRECRNYSAGRLEVLAENVLRQSPLIFAMTLLEGSLDTLQR